jgi:hypothetical protein
MIEICSRSMMPTLNFLFNGPAAADVLLALAHGAGAPMDSPFMEIMAGGLAERGIRVARFEFPYMARRRLEGSRRPPDRQPVLLEHWRAVHAALARRHTGRLLIGGKSMGGRMATMVADELGADGVVCLGYPFHPAGRPERTRVEHLASLRTPTLILQGERDALGDPDDVAGYALSPAIEVIWLGDGDHDLKPRKKSGRTLEQNLEQAMSAIADFAGR